VGAGAGNRPGYPRRLDRGRHHDAKRVAGEPVLRLPGLRAPRGEVAVNSRRLLGGFVLIRLGGADLRIAIAIDSIDR